MRVKKYITFGKPSIGADEINAVKQVIISKWIGSGPITEQFEKKFKKYKQSRYSLSLNSCTAALHLSLRVLNIKKNDEVITTPLTFCSTINSILLVGAKPVLVDINPFTLNIDEKKIEKKISKKTKAILLVHFSGLPCNMAPILKLTKKYNIKIIEDCAHAIESKYFGKHVGNFGETGCFSFYATKNFTTGEGGMLITNKKKIRSKINVMRLHGMSKHAWKRHLPESVQGNQVFKHYDVTEVGLKYNMIDINASMGLVQLRKINKYWKKRKSIHDNYTKKLKHLPLLFQKINPYPVKYAYHLFVIRIDNTKTNKKRDSLIKFLAKNNIGSGVNYRSVTDMTYYKKYLGWNHNTCKIAKLVGDNILSLPLYPALNKNKANYICKIVCEFFQK
jgi:dTDP-4-amino-4,6-dideoxygalactose transaminase